MDPVTIVFNKPFGVLTQFTDPAGTGRPTLSDYIPFEGVYPAGRLDADSEGLLVLTSDGALQHRLTDPQFHHEKTYWVQVEGAPRSADLEPLRRGIVIQGYRARSARVKILRCEPPLWPRRPPVRCRKSIPTTWLEITLTEGRNRQVRRMTAAVGFPTLRLIRAAIGNIGLGGLAPGAWRRLRPEETGDLQVRSPWGETQRGGQ